ncbi:MAG: 50S ribosomal protein L25 [Acidobacteriota bacterium]
MTTREVHLEVQPRTTKAGSAESRRLRNAGQIPAVVYGGGVAPESILFDARPVLQLLSTEGGRNSLIHLKIGDRELRRMVMLKEVQVHPITGRLLHADFARVEMDRKIVVDVPVHIVGTAVGVKSEGGLLDLIHRTVRVKVLPAEIPSFIELDVTELHTGQHVEASELKLPTGVELVMSPHDTIVTVLGKTAEAEEAAGPAADAAAAQAPAPETKG